MTEVVQSAWGIVYYLEKDGQPRYLLIKRLALSGKIERVAPKWKIQAGEKPEEAALREVSEECWIQVQHLRLKQKIGMTSLRSSETKRGHLDKDVTYFLMLYTWDPLGVKITDGEGYIWVYKRATIDQVLGLLYYEDIRELMRKSFFALQESNKNQSIRKAFMEKLD